MTSLSLKINYIDKDAAIFNHFIILGIDIEIVKAKASALHGSK